MDRRVALALLVAACAHGLPGRRALAQAPTISTEISGTPGSLTSSLGPTPGAGAVPFGASPGEDTFYLGGRPGPSNPRVPASIATPGGGLPALGRLGIAAPAPLAITNVPLYGPLEVPEIAEREGPPDGLTLDAALARLLEANLYLRANALQIDKSRADVLTASLRANPILYADSQLVPYGQYSRSRNGGPTQYDVNVQHPVDLSRKRKARTAVAERVADIVEAMYQDAVRLEIDNLYTAYVNVLSARETVRYAQASIAGLKRVVEANEALYRRATATRPDVDRVRMLQDRAEIGLIQAEEVLRRTKRALGMLLSIPPEQSERIELRGRLVELTPRLPGVDDLIAIALSARSDLVALRLAIQRAEADVKLARANGFADAFLLYQPYTFQDNAPFGLKSSTSWALGGTVPLPLFNRNQGGVLRSRLNVEQTRSEAAAGELAVIAEVRQAEREYATTREMLIRMERDVVPAARSAREDTLELITRGELTALASYNAQRDYNEAVRVYRDMAVRHRRSMLRLNTIVGRRVLP
jgi:cobalt-zinc-cadmium efflux system outer membrane protein